MNLYEKKCITVTAEEQITLQHPIENETNGIAIGKKKETNRTATLNV